MGIRLFVGLIALQGFRIIFHELCAYDGTQFCQYFFCYGVKFCHLLQSFPCYFAIFS